MYGHRTVEDLTALRTRLEAALEARLTAPTVAGANGRTVQYDTRVIADLQRQIRDITNELAVKAGTVSSGPIYLV
jgi:hypothetical protein